MSRLSLNRIGNIALGSSILLTIIGIAMAILVDTGGKRPNLILPSIILAMIFTPLLLLGIICKVDQS